MVAVTTPQFSPVDVQATPSGKSKDSQSTARPIQLAAAEEPFSEATSERALEAKHDTVASELRVALLQEKVGPDATSEQSKTEESSVDYLKQIDVTIAQQKAATGTLHDIQAKQAELEVELSKLVDGRLEIDPPYSILLLDQLHDSVNSGKTLQEGLEASLQSAREAVERAHLSVEDRKKNLRQLNERTSAEDPTVKAAELEVRLAEESLVLRKTQTFRLVQRFRRQRVSVPSSLLDHCTHSSCDEESGNRSPIFHRSIVSRE